METPDAGTDDDQILEEDPLMVTQTPVFHD
jgi:hypothetical protein